MTMRKTRTTINESKMRMGIFSHPFRLPRQGRGTGDNYNHYGSGAFIVRFFKNIMEKKRFRPLLFLLL